MESRSGPRLIGVAGGTAGGKTTFCLKQREILPPGGLEILSLDSYYRCNRRLPLEERGRVNYDHPRAFEAELLVRHLKELRSGAGIEAPCYDFATHSRAPGTRPVRPAQFILVEGILTLHWPELREIFEYRIFVDAPADLRLERRMQRDVAERGRTPESVLRQWNETVEPMYREFCEPTRRFADRIVDGTAEEYEDIRAILAAP